MVRAKLNEFIIMSLTATGPNVMVRLMCKECRTVIYAWPDVTPRQAMILVDITVIAASHLVDKHFPETVKD